MVWLFDYRELIFEVNKLSLMYLDIGRLEDVEFKRFLFGSVLEWLLIGFCIMKISFFKYEGCRGIFLFVK